MPGDFVSSWCCYRKNSHLGSHGAHTWQLRLEMSWQYEKLVWVCNSQHFTSLFVCLLILLACWLARLFFLFGLLICVDGGCLNCWTWKFLWIRAKHCKTNLFSERTNLGIQLSNQVGISTLPRYGLRKRWCHWAFGRVTRGKASTLSQRTRMFAMPLIFKVCPKTCDWGSQGVEIFKIYCRHPALA